MALHLVGGFMPKGLPRMPNTCRLLCQRKSLIVVSAKRGPVIGKGGGGKINDTSKAMDGSETMREQKLSTLGSEEEDEKKSKEKVDDGTKMNPKA